MEQEIRVVIVEDMQDYIGVIEMLLMEVAPWVRVAGKATSLSVAEQMIEEISPDAVLLDIQFENEGKTCFEMLSSLKTRNLLNFQIIIITAHFEKQYYASAFEYKAIHFLEKPVNKIRLREALERVKESHLVQKIEALATIVESELVTLKSVPQSTKIIIQGLRFSEIVDLNEIVWIEADGRKSNIYLRNEKKITSSDSIGFFEKQLKSHLNFFKINRSEILNTSYVERYAKKEKLVVISGKLPNHFVSKERFNSFLEMLHSNKSETIMHYRSQNSM